MSTPNDDAPKAGRPNLDGESGKSKRLILSMPEDQLATLKRAARRKGLTVAAFVRRAIDEALNASRRPK